MRQKHGYMPWECIDIPKILFEDENFSKLSVDARILYALLLDRKNSSALMNEWTDEDGMRYVIYSKNEMMQNLNANGNHVDSVLAELYENEGMVVMKQSDSGEIRIYVKDITNLKQVKEPDEMNKQEEMKENQENTEEKECIEAEDHTSMDDMSEKESVAEQLAKVQSGLFCMRCEEMTCTERKGHLMGMFSVLADNIENMRWFPKDETENNGNIASDSDSEECNIRQRHENEDPDDIEEEEYDCDFSMDLSDVLGGESVYHSLPSKQRKVFDMKWRGFINDRGKIDKNGICEYAGEDGLQLALFLLCIEQDNDRDLTDFYTWLDNLRCVKDYKTLTIIISTLLHLLYGNEAEKHIFDMTCGNKKVKKIYLKMLLDHMEDICDMAINTEG